MIFFKYTVTQHLQTMFDDPSAYNIANWATAGLASTVKGAIVPEKPFSAQHWVDSLATASLIMPVVNKIPVKSVSTVAKSSTVIKTASKGSTGRVTPLNLNEQLAMKQVKSNPIAGTPLKKVSMTDPRWPASQGWVKMQQLIPTSKGNINIHYVYNQSLQIYDDFKFKN